MERWQGARIWRVRKMGQIVLTMRAGDCSKYAGQPSANFNDETIEGRRMNALNRSVGS